MRSCKGAGAVGHKAQFVGVQQTPILLPPLPLVAVPSRLLHLEERVAEQDVVRQGERKSNQLRMKTKYL